MSETERVLDATIDEVWAVLADGWSYPLFVVGASRMRDVDEGWPAVGTSLHHSVGTWPLLIDDTTEVTECVPPTRLRLRARAWPAGEADVLFELRAVDGRTELTITEKPVRGPGALIPRIVHDPMLAWRNVEALRRLAYLAERR